MKITNYEYVVYDNQPHPMKVINHAYNTVVNQIDYTSIKTTSKLLLLNYTSTTV